MAAPLYPSGLVDVKCFEVSDKLQFVDIKSGYDDKLKFVGHSRKPRGIVSEFHFDAVKGKLLVYLF